MTIQKVLFFVLLLTTLTDASPKNVCKSWPDYYLNFFNLGFRCYYDPNADNATPSDMIVRHGFPLIKYRITSKDGYILTLLRIPSERRDAIPVLLVHKYLDSSTSFVSNKNDSIVFLLSKAGYEIFTLDVRGSIYASQHMTIPIKSSLFWDFCFDDTAHYDIQAAVDAIDEMNGRKIIYIGHNTGATHFLQYSSRFPAKAKRHFSLNIGMAPVAELKHSLFLWPVSDLLGKLSPDIWHFLYLLDLAYYVSYVMILRSVELLIKSTPIGMQVLFVILTNFCGKNKHIPPERAPYFFNSYITGGGIKNLLNLYQYFYGGFRMFDYGSTGNLLRYGMEQPPTYNLSKVSVDSLFIYSKSDRLINDPEIAFLMERLPRKSTKYGPIRIEAEGFSSFDFLYAPIAKTLVYKPILNFLATIHPSYKNFEQVDETPNPNLDHFVRISPKWGVARSKYAEREKNEIFSNSGELVDFSGHKFKSSGIKAVKDLKSVEAALKKIGKILISPLLFMLRKIKGFVGKFLKLIDSVVKMVFKFVFDLEPIKGVLKIVGGIFGRANKPEAFTDMDMDNLMTFLQQLADSHLIPQLMKTLKPLLNSK